MIGETCQATGTYGFHSFARDDSSGVDAHEAPLIRVDEAVRMALTPEPANGAGDSGSVVAGVSAIPVVNAPPKLSSLVSAATFHALQEWEGHVLEINEDEFVAALVDLTAGSSDEGEEAIIPLTEIADDDAAALRVGGIFRWVIGYEPLSFRHQETCFPDRVSRSSPNYRTRPAARQGVGTRDQTGIQTVRDGGTPPRDDEFELTLLGPGYGESIVMHIGEGAWVLVDSCGRADAPAALDYLETLGIDPAKAVKLIVASHWHDDHICGIAHMARACSTATFCCASVLCAEEFLAAFHALEHRHLCRIRFRGPRDL